jgi:hypothetical protein
MKPTARARRGFRWRAVARGSRYDRPGQLGEAGPTGS